MARGQGASKKELRLIQEVGKYEGSGSVFGEITNIKDRMVRDKYPCDLSKLRAVRIDEKTTIYVEKSDKRTDKEIIENREKRLQK